MKQLPTVLTPLAAILLIATPAEAQEITTDADAVKALAPFFSALSETQADGADRVVRVAWWGDSAIVSDGYTGQVRARLQKRFGDAGPGFVLASPTFDGYMRRGLRLKRTGWSENNVIQGGLSSGRYGYGGIRVTSWGGASSTFIDQDGTFDTVHVMYEAGPKAGNIQIFVDGAGAATDTRASEADATEDAVWTYALAKPAKEVRVRAAGGGLVTLYGVALERKGPGVVIDALGLLGMRARRWDNADQAHLSAQIAARAPALLVINFGGNERVDGDLSVAKHQEDILGTIKRFKAGAPTAACLVMGALAHGEKAGGSVKLDPALDTIYKAQRAAADKAGCAFFDTIAAMGGGDEAIRSFRKRKLIGADLAHLNGKGHKVVGDLISDWLLAHYDAWARQSQQGTRGSEGG